jgi:hypothetical protein
MAGVAWGQCRPRCHECTGDCAAAMGGEPLFTSSLAELARGDRCRCKRHGRFGGGCAPELHHWQSERVYFTAARLPLSPAKISLTVDATVDTAHIAGIS